MKIFLVIFADKEAYLIKAPGVERAQEIVKIELGDDFTIEEVIFEEDVYEISLAYLY